MPTTKAKAPPRLPKGITRMRRTKHRVELRVQVGQFPRDEIYDVVVERTKRGRGPIEVTVGCQTHPLAWWRGAAGREWIAKNYHQAPLDMAQEYRELIERAVVRDLPAAWVRDQAEVAVRRHERDRTYFRAIYAAAMQSLLRLLPWALRELDNPEWRKRRSVG